MTRADLSQAVSKESGLCIGKADKAVSAVLGQMKEIVAEGRLSIRGLGSFQAREKAERNGRNPKTGELAKISARRVVQFKAYRKFKTLVNGGGK